MRRTLRLNNQAEVLFTENEHGYDAVLADAREGGGELFIVAYAITVKGDGMLKMLQDGIPGVRRIEFLTNIPTFHRRSWSGKWAQDAKSEIAEYLKILHPDSLHPTVSAAIVTGNHSKLAVSDRVVYVGSANFSDESAKKKEAGVLIRDEAIVQRLRSMFKETYREDIYRYNPKVFNLLSIFGGLEELKESTAALLKSLQAQLNDETAVFDVSSQDIDQIQRWTSEMEDVFGALIEILSGDALEEGGVETPEPLTFETLQAGFEAMVSDEVNGFLKFSREGYIDRRVHELTMDDPEALDAASEQANQEAEDQVSELFDAAWQTLEPILMGFPAMVEALETLSASVRRDLRDLRYLENE